jgi:hypothetical protein
LTGHHVHSPRAMRYHTILVPKIECTQVTIRRPGRWTSTPSSTGRLTSAEKGLRRLTSAEKRSSAALRSTAVATHLLSGYTRFLANSCFDPLFRRRCQFRESRISGTDGSVSAAGLLPSRRRRLRRGCQCGGLTMLMSRVVGPRASSVPSRRARASSGSRSTISWMPGTSVALYHHAFFHARTRPCRAADRRLSAASLSALLIRYRSSCGQLLFRVCGGRSRPARKPPATKNEFIYHKHARLFADFDCVFIVTRPARDTRAIHARYRRDKAKRDRCCTCSMLLL